ncbi:MAG: cation:proton antiporter [Pirellulales bacterium]
MSSSSGPTADAPRRSAARGAFVYLAMLVVSIGLFFGIRHVGEEAAAARANDQAATASQAVGSAGTSETAIAKPPKPKKLDIVLHVLVALVAVIVVGNLLGRLCQLIGQPRVIGEILAGIALGPSLLGVVWPEAQAFLLPGPDVDPGKQVFAALQIISQLGVILYMFLVGLELNGARLRHQAHAAVAISHASILLPFTLGAALALWLHADLAPAGVSFTSFALFLGTAMAITAFPVLARILTDRKMEKTPLGVLALGCAATDDVTAWCILAVVVGIAGSDPGQGPVTILWASVYVAAMLLIVRPFAARWLRRFEAAPLTPIATAIVLAAVLASALATEAIGIHAIFGAFLLGAIIPADSRAASEFHAKLHDAATILLLPAFFALTGMRTRIALVEGWENWLICGVVVATATVGKFAGSLFAARAMGMTWRDSGVIGALMNTRGLMELIVLNVGLDLGVISPTLFAMMVVMALATTLMTAPLLRLFMPRETAAVA